MSGDYFSDSSRGGLSGGDESDLESRLSRLLSVSPYPDDRRPSADIIQARSAPERERPQPPSSPIERSGSVHGSAPTPTVPVAIEADDSSATRTVLNPIFKSRRSRTSPLSAAGVAADMIITSKEMFDFGAVLGHGVVGKVRLVLAQPFSGASYFSSSFPVFGRLLLAHARTQASGLLSKL